MIHNHAPLFSATALFLSPMRDKVRQSLITSGSIENRTATGRDLWRRFQGWYEAPWQSFTGIKRLKA